MNVSTLDARGLRAVLFGVVLAVAGTATLTAWAHPGGGPGRHEGGAMMLGGSPKHIDRVLDSVDATEAQRTQVQQIAAAARADLKAQREAGRALREQQLQLFAQPTVDANAVEALRRQMLTQHDQASQRITQAMLDVSRVLTPEQRAKLAERAKARAERMQRHQRERKGG